MRLMPRILRSNLVELLSGVITLGLDSTSPLTMKQPRSLKKKKNWRNLRKFKKIHQINIINLLFVCYIPFSLVTLVYGKPLI